MALEPLLKVVEKLTEQIDGAERGIGRMAREHYPEVVVLNLEGPRRFRRNRCVDA